MEKILVISRTFPSLVWGPVTRLLLAFYDNDLACIYEICPNTDNVILKIFGGLTKCPVPQNVNDRQFRDAGDADEYINESLLNEVG